MRLNIISLEKILSKYDLREVISAKVFETGTVQTNVFIKTNKGEYVLKVYKQNRSFESVLFEVYLLKYLKGRNYPCPMPIRNNEGEFVGLSKSKPFVLFEFLEGKHVKNPNEIQKKQIIQKIAELQKYTENYISPYIGARWNYTIEFCKLYAEKKAESINTENSQKKLGWYLKQLSKLNLSHSYPKGICHCDFNFSNVLFKQGKFNALLDFDDANYTFLTFDLVSFFEPKTFLFDHKSWEDIQPDGSMLDFSDAKFCMREYEKYRKLCPIEKRYLFDMLKFVIIIDCLWFFERGDVTSFFERKKIECLDALGRKRFYQKLFG